MADNVPHQDLDDAINRGVSFESWKTLQSVPSNATVVRDQVSFYHDRYEASGKTMFQLIRNNHKVIIWGPPLVRRANLTMLLELIESLNFIDFDDIRQSTLYIAWDGHSRLIPQDDEFFQIPYFAGYRCVDDSQLQVTEWLQAGWKRALLDGVRPVEVEYAYNRTSALALQCMINGFRDLEALDLTTPVVACLARDGRMIGVVKAVEEGARMMSYKDRTLVYSAFGKMQGRHIYLLDGHDMQPSAVLIVGNKVRFVDMALKRWFSSNIFIYDRTIHNKEQLERAQKAHWRQAEVLFERILNARTGTSNRYRECEYRLVNIISAPELPLTASSTIPPVTSKRRKKCKRKCTEPQQRRDVACDSEYLPGQDKGYLDTAL